MPMVSLAWSCAVTYDVYGSNGVVADVTVDVAVMGMAWMSMRIAIMTMVMPSMNCCGNDDAVDDDGACDEYADDNEDVDGDDECVNVNGGVCVDDGDACAGYGSDGDNGDMSMMALIVSMQ